MDTTTKLPSITPMLYEKRQANDNGLHFLGFALGTMDEHTHTDTHHDFEAEKKEFRIRTLSDVSDEEMMERNGRAGE